MSVPPEKSHSEMLRKRLLNGIESVFGSQLSHIRYRALPSELDASDFETSIPYIGGEIHLDFSGRSLILTWDKKMGWPDHFSLYAGTQPLFLPDAQMEWWNAETLCPWSQCIGKCLTLATVYADNQTPHLLLMRFESVDVLVADGSHDFFCDGDDLLIRDEIDMPDLSMFEVVWSHEIAIQDLHA